MEGFLLVCFFVLLVMVLVNRSRQKNERAEDRQTIRDLISRIYFLEDAVTKLKRVEKESATPGGASPASTPSAKPSDEVATATVKATPPPVPLKAPVVAPPPPAPKPVETPVTHRPGSVTPASVPVPPPVVSRPAAPPAPQFAAVRTQPEVPLREQLKSWLDVAEEKLGRNWLGKIGISLVVLGVAAYLATKIPLLPPMGKVLVGISIGALILGGGIWLEHKERYRILARSCIGGGWAILFFLSWAVYYLEPTRIITSGAIDFVLMLSVALVMVWHTLRYRSQAVTGLAYLLAFLTVGMNHDQVPFVGGLGAGILLVLGLVVIAGRHQWFELELFGILASYLNHFFWLQPIIREMHGSLRPFPEFAPSAAVLVAYWLIFRVSYVWRKTKTPQQERISTASALLNPALLLALLKYQSVHKEWAFWGLLAIGAIETLLGQLPITRRRRPAVIVLSTLGVVLLVAAFPFRYSGANLSVLWLVEAEALVLIGVWTAEIVFRRLGLLATLLVAGHMVVVDAYRVYASRIESAGISHLPLAVVFAVAAILFYGNAHWVSQRWPDLFSRKLDRFLLQRLSYIAALMAFVAAWLAFPEAWTAVAWCALAASLAWAGRRFVVNELFYQANVLSAAGIVRVLAINLDETASYGHFSVRFITVGLVAALLYWTAHWSWETGKPVQPSRWRRVSNAGYTWTASFLLALLVWYELREHYSAAVAVVWVSGGLALGWMGRKLAKRDLTYQANAAAAAAVARVWLVNYDAGETYHHLSLRLITVTLVAVLLYVSSRWSWVDRANSVSQPRWVADIYTWAGSILLAVLAWYEVQFAAVAVVWALGGLVLALVGRWLANRNLTYQSNLLALAAFVRTILVNYHATDLFHGFTERLISVLLTASLIYISSRWSWEEESGEREFVAGSYSFPFSHVVSGAYLWAASFLLSLLAWYELQPVSVAVAWMVGGLVLLEFGLGRKSVSLRCQAYVALVSAFTRIFFVNLNAGGEGISPRLYTVVPIALALFYAYWRLLESQPQLRPGEQKVQIAEFFCWLGMVSVVALLRFELQPDWVATGWAALALILLAAARVANRTFLHQALLLSFAILFRTVLHNFYQRSYFPPSTFWQSRWVLVGSTVMFMFAGLPFLFRLRRRESAACSGVIRRTLAIFDRHPEQVFFFIATGLLSAMLALETSRGMMTLSWALEGLAIFLLALLAAERSFRLTGLTLLLLCVAKILVWDVWQLRQHSDRYLTFIVLGAALVLVHFLYSRYRETILKYL